MLSRGDHRSRRKDEIDHRTNRNGASRHRCRAESHEKGHRWRAGGVTAKELLKVTGWQPHSLRGFLSGTVGKKMGLTVTSAKGEDGERNYSVKA
jgi:hypothetical protein